ncbi:MAG: type II secretion system protein N [Pseudomonadota bacterium]
MKKNSAKKTAVSVSARSADVVAENRAQRPWMLILLGVATVGFVLVVQLGGHSRSGKGRVEEKVYSSAAESLEPMAVASRQTGLLEPAGVAKPLYLFRVKVGSSAREGLAVLGAAEASSRTYVAGALLENGARLSELYSDHVVLIRAGQRYTLYLPQKGQSDALADKSTTRLMVGGFEPAAPPVSPPAVRVSDAIRVTPAYEGDQIVGFHVYPGAKAGQMERWGLVSGDVLVSLSGQPLATAEQFESAMEQVAEGASIQAEVRRGQELLPMTLDGTMLMASVPSASPPPPMP